MLLCGKGRTVARLPPSWHRTVAHGAACGVASSSEGDVGHSKAPGDAVAAVIAAATRDAES